MSSGLKTSSRKSRRRYKAYNKKYGGVWKEKKVLMKEHTRWFFEGYSGLAMPLSYKYVMEMAQKIIVANMTKGAKLPEIKEHYHNDLKVKKKNKIACNILGMAEVEYVEKFVGEDYDYYVMDWVIAVGVCMKLKVIPNDMNNGVLKWCE